jgi:tRNA threonylcarbamoyladenosine biosynthesis protein TsaE
MFKVSKSIEETQNIAREVLENLPVFNKASIVGLSGELGAGKTTFTQELAKVLRVTERVTSPTFVILKIYEIEHERFKKIIHIDAYRLKSGSELTALSLTEEFKDPTNLVLVEWYENVSDVLPQPITTIELEPINEYTRNITITYGQK